MNIVVDGLLTTYDRGGRGRTVVLLHGWGDNSATFRDLKTFLATKNDVISLDLPGFGKTESPKEDWGLDEYAHFVANFLQKLGATNIFAILGHSNGGAIAIRGLSKHILSANKLILLASSGIRSEYNGRKKILRLAAKAGKALTYPLPKSAKEKLRKKAYKSIGSEMFVAEHLQGTFKKVVTDDVQSDAAKLTLPTLLIYGSDDTSTPPRYAELFNKAISGSKLDLLRGGGHFIHQDFPDHVNQDIRNFLDA